VNSIFRSACNNLRPKAILMGIVFAIVCFVFNRFNVTLCSKPIELAATPRSVLRCRIWLSGLDRLDAIRIPSSMHAMQLARDASLTVVVLNLHEGSASDIVVLFCHSAERYAFSEREKVRYAISFADVYARRHFLAAALLVRLSPVAAPRRTRLWACFPPLSRCRLL